MITDSERKISPLQWSITDTRQAPWPAAQRKYKMNSIVFWRILSHDAMSGHFLNLQVFMFILSSHILFLWVFWVYEHVFLCVCMHFLCFSFSYFVSFFLIYSLLSSMYVIIRRLFAWMRAKEEGSELGSKSIWEDQGFWEFMEGKP